MKRRGDTRMTRNMKTFNLSLCFAILSASAILSACGGGGGGDNGDSNATQDKGRPAPVTA